MLTFVLCFSLGKIGRLRYVNVVEKYVEKVSECQKLLIFANINKRMRQGYCT